MTLKDKTIIITGAASGIGLNLAHQCLAEGAYVMGVDQPSKKIPIKDLNFHAYYYDLSIAENVDKMFDDGLTIFGTINIFIANAGFAYYERLIEPSWNHIEDIYNINTNSVIYSALKMREVCAKNAFHFICMSSVMSYWPLPGYSLYSSSKAALHAFFKGFRYELNKEQQLHIVFPVSTKTNFFKISGQNHQHWFQQTPEHVAKVILKGVKKNKNNIHPSKIFKWVYRLFPWALSFYINHEIKQLDKQFKRQ